MTGFLAVTSEPALRSDPAEFATAQTEVSSTADSSDITADACSDLGSTGWAGFTGEAATALGVLVQAVGVSLSTIPAGGRQFADALDVAATALDGLKTRSDLLLADAQAEQTLLDNARVALEDAITRHRNAAWQLTRLIDVAYDNQLIVVNRLQVDVTNAETVVTGHETEITRLQGQFDEIRDEEDQVHFDLAAAEMRLEFPDAMTSPDVSALVGSAGGVIDLFDAAIQDSSLHPAHRDTLREARDALEDFLGQPPTPDGSSKPELTAAALAALVDAQAAIDSGGIFEPTHVVTGGSTADHIEVTQLGTGELQVTVNGTVYTLNAEEAARIEIDAGGGDDTIIINDSVTVGIAIHGGTGDDTITGGSGNDDIDGGTGDDVIDAGWGNDIVDGGRDGDDVIEAGWGNDLVSGGSGTDTINSGAGIADLLMVPPFASSFGAKGHHDNDRVLGGAGSDDISTGGGNDTVSGGRGNDTVDAGHGSDLVDGGGGGDDLRGGADADTISGGTGIDYIDGGDGDDVLIGQDGDDVIYGSDGADTIDGGRGNDYLDGGTDGDVIEGGNGNDLVAGGTGDDQLTGGEGNDTVFTGSGVDHVDVTGDSGDDTVHAETHDTVDADDGDDVRARSDIDPSLGNSVVITGTPEFQARIEADMELFRQSPEGRELLESLDASGHTVTIVETVPGSCRSDTGSCASADGGLDAFRDDAGTPGPGSDGTANIHLPGRLNSGGVLNDTPPSVVIFHELLHNQDFVNGTLEDGMSLDPGNPVNHNAITTDDDYDNNRELSVVGLDFDPFRDLDGDGVDDVGDGKDEVPSTPAVVETNRRGTTENSFRVNLGYDLREQY